MSWRFAWRPDRMQKLHELGQAFDLTEDATIKEERTTPAVKPTQPEEDGAALEDQRVGPSS